MKLKGTNLDDLFTYFLLIEQYRNDLMTEGNYEGEWGHVIPGVMSDLRLKPCSNNGISLSNLLNEIFENMNHQAMHRATELICQKGGTFQ